MKTNHCGRNYTETGATFTLRCSGEFQCPECRDKDKLLDLTTKFTEEGGKKAGENFVAALEKGLAEEKTYCGDSFVVETIGKREKFVCGKAHPTTGQRPQCHVCEVADTAKKLGYKSRVKTLQPGYTLFEFTPDDPTTRNFRKKILAQLDEEKRSGTHEDMVLALGLTAEKCGTTSDELEVEKARAKKYGDFKINMLALTKVIEAMASQSLQQDVKLPDNFGALLMCEVKVLRECFMSDPDNGIDHFNYLRIAREMSDLSSP